MRSSSSTSSRPSENIPVSSSANSSRHPRRYTSNAKATTCRCTPCSANSPASTGLANSPVRRSRSNEPQRPGATLRPGGHENWTWRPPEKAGEYVLNLNNEIAAVAGYLTHYNKPFADTLDGNPRRLPPQGSLPASPSGEVRKGMLFSRPSPRSTLQHEKP